MDIATLSVLCITLVAVHHQRHYDALMPTANPRLTITLTPTVAAVLREMSGLVGNSQSAIVGELLETSLPVFERVVKALQAAQNIRDTAKDEIAAGLGRAQAKVEAQLPLIMGDMDEALRPLLEEAEKVKRRGARSGDARSAAPERAPRSVQTPVPLTGGSGGQPEARKPVRRGARRGRV